MTGAIRRETLAPPGGAFALLRQDRSARTAAPGPQRQDRSAWTDEIALRSWVERF